MGKINWLELFPTKSSAIVFVSYMLLFVNQGILVTASQGSKNDYNYSTVTVVLFTEVLKLILSIILYCKNNKLSSLVSEVTSNRQLLLLYFVPAFLYCLYNNLAFANLATFDPTTYFLLLQLRVVITGVLFQVIFKKYLSRIQWFSLLLLTAGCMLKQVNFGETYDETINKNTKGFDLSFSAVLILIQTFCSCFAGVYNEHLLKYEGADVNVFVQNVFMYLDSIVCNIAVLLLQGDVSSVLALENLKVVFHYKVLFIIINNAIVGIITSFFLKSLNSILKTFASALELIIIAVLSFLFFGIPIHLNTVLAICVVSYSIILYSQNPVVNVPVPKAEEQQEFLKHVP